MIFNLISAARHYLLGKRRNRRSGRNQYLAHEFFSLAKHWNSFAATALDTLRRPGCRARARAHLYVCVVMPLCISACFCVYVFALSVQLSCRDSETRGAKRLIVGPSYLFALLFQM